MGDIGIIESSKCRIQVTDTMKFLGKIIGHVCELKEGYVNIHNTVTLSVNTTYRQCLKSHHTATHILHAVLREVLGSHIAQKGSLVASDRLRFDISHTKPVTRAQIKLVEDKVNLIIRNNSQVCTSLMSTQLAIESGAMALFGEKYVINLIHVVQAFLSSDAAKSP